ncbi:MAG: hypothetical protein EOO12_17365 [Chitinophagaceae bacterium]|nr:MAG: hypothetical protein EOO12_17365 [Chitinophagaceae bacterium]
MQEHVKLIWYATPTNDYHDPRRPRPHPRTTAPRQRPLRRLSGRKGRTRRGTEKGCAGRAARDFTRSGADPLHRDHPGRLSPIATALIGYRKGDTVRCNLPGGPRSYVIVEVWQEGDL